MSERPIRYNGQLAKIERRATVLAVVVGVAIAVAIAFTALDSSDEAWEPLGPFPVQTVQDSDLVVDVSAGQIKIEATKCREGTDGIQVEGDLAWRRVSPPGFTSELVLFAPSVQSNGCTVETFENSIPNVVHVDVCATGPSDWQVTGTETPIGDLVGDTVRAREGLSLGWETEVFTLTCE